MRTLFFACFILSQTFCFGKYTAQWGQDRFINETFFKDLKNGVFVDIGAHNGVIYSNTYHFEKELQWNGICVEPLPERFKELSANRSCTCVQGCVCDIEGPSKLIMVSSPFVNTEMLSGLLHKYDPKHLERLKKELKHYGGTCEVIDVQCYLFNKLLEREGIKHVNLLSIDTEGGEFDILSSIDFSKNTIDVIAVEDNYNDARFQPFLKKMGYRFVKRIWADLLFVREKFVTDTVSQ